MAVGIQFLGPVPQTVGVNGQTTTLSINGGGSTFNAGIAFQANGVNRWLIRKNGDTESGGNVGSDFEISARTDAGGPASICLAINRQTFTVTIGQGATGNPSLVVTGNDARSVNVVTYGTSVTPDPTLGRFQQLTVTDGVAFQWINPTYHTTGMEMVLDVFNNSGGAMGAVTFNNGYKLAGAFVAPANGKHRLYAFYWTGSIWMETYRSAADL